MEVTSQAAIVNKVRHQKLIIFPIIKRNKRQQIRMRQPSQPPHVAVKLISSGGVHFPESLHHHRRPIRKHRFVRRPKAPTAQNFGRRPEQFLEAEPRPVGPHEVQTRPGRTAHLRVVVRVGRGILVGLFRPFEEGFGREE